MPDTPQTEAFLRPIIELEWLAASSHDAGCYSFELTAVIDTRPLIREIVRDVRQGVARAIIARRFHTTLLAMIVAVCQQLRGQTALTSVVLSGGVFMNSLLTSEVAARLERDGFHVYRHRLVPPNDGGLSLGQLAIAAKSLEEHPT